MSLTKASVLSVSWRGRVFDTSLVGKPVQFTHQEALQLFTDQMKFVVSKLV